jgi:CRP/FNR family cyclic AMP-dependent transcriptional regulator
MNSDRLELLQAMPVFGAIGDDTLEFLLQRARSVDVAAGAYFFREQDRAESMFVLETGLASVLKGWRGHELEINRLGAGDCFGEMALMDLFPRSASVRAVEPCRAIEIANAALAELFEHDLEQFALIQMNLGREVSRRLRTTDELLFRLKVDADAEPPEPWFR